MYVHQHGVFLLDSVNFWETFATNIWSLGKRTDLKLGEVSYLVIFHSVHHNFLPFSIGWFWIYFFFFIAWQWKRSVPFEDRSNLSMLSAMIVKTGKETLCRQSHNLLTAGSEILRRHRRIYLSCWPWLPTVTMPDHRVITTFTSVKFLLSFAAFTEVSVGVYTRKMFTLVSKLWYLGKPFKSKHSNSIHGWATVERESH